MKRALVLVLGATLCSGAAIAIPAAASAQPYYGGGYHQPHPYYRDLGEECRDEKRKQRDTGRVLGALAGAVIGSQVAADGARTEGAVVGAAAGAVVGGEIGRKNAKRSSVCDRQGPYWAAGHTYYSNEYDRHYGFDRDYDRGRDCRWANDRFGNPVRVCRDRQGRYRPY